jgi:acyl-[acyl-carrier-protein] desaturase
VNRWTVEVNRHGIALRDYLIVTRAVDPIALEQARIEQMTAASALVGKASERYGQGSEAAKFEDSKARYLERQARKVRS